MSELPRTGSCVLTSLVSFLHLLGGRPAGSSETTASGGLPCLQWKGQAGGEIGVVAPWIPSTCLPVPSYCHYSGVLLHSLPPPPHLPVIQLSSVQWLSPVRFFATPWTAACQASLSITSSLSLLKLMSVDSVMPSNHLILCRPLLLLPSVFPNIRSFPRSQLFASVLHCIASVLNQYCISIGQSIGASASASVLPMNSQD